MGGARSHEGAEEMTGLRAGTGALWGRCCSQAPEWPQKGPRRTGCTHPGGSASPRHDVLDEGWGKGWKSATTLVPLGSLVSSRALKPLPLVHTA